MWTGWKGGGCRRDPRQDGCVNDLTLHPAIPAQRGSVHGLGDGGSWRGGGSVRLGAGRESRRARGGGGGSAGMQPACVGARVWHAPAIDYPETVAAAFSTLPQLLLLLLCVQVAAEVAEFASQVTHKVGGWGGVFLSVCKHMECMAATICEVVVVMVCPHRGNIP